MKDSLWARIWRTPATAVLLGWLLGGLLVLGIVAFMQRDTLTEYKLASAWVRGGYEECMTVLLDTRPQDYAASQCNARMADIYEEAAGLPYSAQEKWLGARSNSTALPWPPNDNPGLADVTVLRAYLQGTSDACITVFVAKGVALSPELITFCRTRAALAYLTNRFNNPIPGFSNPVPSPLQVWFKVDKSPALPAVAPPSPAPPRIPDPNARNA